MSARRDWATPARRAWCRMGGRQNWRGGIALGLLLALGGLDVRAAGWAIEAGIGAHVPGWSAPDYTTPNPLGIVELRREAGPWVFTLSHTSSLQGFPAVFDSPDEDGYGINQASMRYRFAW